MLKLNPVRNCNRSFVRVIDKVFVEALKLWVESRVEIQSKLCDLREQIGTLAEDVGVDIEDELNVTVN